MIDLPLSVDRELRRRRSQDAGEAETSAEGGGGWPGGGVVGMMME